MLSNAIRILNFDDSIIRQKKLLHEYKGAILNLKDLGPQARFYQDALTRNLLKKRIGDSNKDSPTFLGSGDFHHISEILISRFSEPINLIVFDFHPDWDTHPPRFGCGSWVSEILKRKNIAKVFLLGVSSNDIDSFWIHSGNLASLAADKVEIYPYEHLPSKTCFKKIPANSSIRIEQGKFFNTIHWQELKERNLADFFDQVIKQSSSVGKTYISLDKDCLRADFALTNWEEGKFSLSELLFLLRLIKENFDIVGMDILGDYSPVRVKGLIKSVASYFDHPRDIPANSIAQEKIDSLNEAANLKILELMNS